MKMQPIAVGLGENAVGPNTFGGNFLFNRDELGDDHEDFNSLANELGVSALRYPGGAITEYMFDINEPDKTIGYDKLGFEHDLVPLSEFLSYAEEEDKSVTIVLPTRTQLSSARDINGDRYADFDPEELSKFVTDVISGHYGDAKIDGFEIGNEYWGSGEMSSIEYGRLASKMAEVIDKTLHNYQGDNEWVEETEIIVQAGTNYGASQLSEDYAHMHDKASIISKLEKDYDIKFDDSFAAGDGNVNWTAVNNALLINEFDTEAEHAAVDAVAHHLYTRDLGPADDEEFHLKTISNQWEPEFDSLKTYITEWNQKGNTKLFDDDEDYGLHNAHELLNIMEDMTQHGVDTAHVWPLSQWSPNALARGHDFDTLSPGGEMFKMMNEELPGLRPVQFQSAKGVETEASSEDNNLNIHAFASEDRLVMYLASNSENGISYDVDTSSLMGGFGNATATRLGVQEGDAAGSVRSSAEVQKFDASSFMNDGTIEADLMPLEILQIVIEDPEWTPQMQEIISQEDDILVDPPIMEDILPLPKSGPSAEDDEPLLPVKEHDPYQDEIMQEEEEAEEDDVDVFDGMEFLLILLPLLGLFAAL